MSQGRRGQAQLHPNMRVKLEPDGGGGTPPVTQPYPNGIGKALTVTNGLEGKRRKVVVQKTQKAQNGTGENNNLLHQQWSSTSQDGSVHLKILSQPESQHRARYQTEGSRGAIKDSTGTGFPTLRIEGYRKPTRIQIFIANDSGRITPHMFYQVCRVSGKNSNPCDEKKIDGTDVIEIPFEPQLNDMTIVCDCVGILKERFADVEARFPKHKTWKNSKKKSTKCRLVFTATVENKRGEPETLQVVSDVINCTQLPGTPEILKMNTSGSSVLGGEELWIIGKNFLKDTKVIFSHSVPGKTEPLWSKFTDPEQELLHQTHLITKIPPFYDEDITEDVEVTVYIKCGDKLSDPTPFTYRPKPFQFTYSQVGDSPASKDSTLPRGVAAPAVAIAQQFAQTGSVSVISNLEKVESELAAQSRPTILEPLHYHKNKKSRLDYAGRNAKRTRSVPAPNLINEDTVFVSEGTGMKVVYTSFAQNPMSPWKGRSPAPEGTPVMVQPLVQPLNVQPSILPDPLQTPAAKRSFSFTDESSNTCFSQNDQITQDTRLDENSRQFSDFSSSLTTDFSNVFSFKRSTPCDTTVTSVTFANSLPQAPPTVVEPTVDQVCNNRPSSASVSTRPPSANDIVNEDKTDSELPNVSVKATADEKATISISLPTSILRDQKHFQSVIETINNTLLRSSFNDSSADAESEAKETPVSGGAVPTFPVTTTNTSTPSWSSESGARSSPGCHSIGEFVKPTPGPASPPLPTSVPVSVLSCRKRTLSSEQDVGAVEQGAEFYSNLTTKPYEELAGCTSVISETPGQSRPQPAPASTHSNYQDNFKPMEVTPSPKTPASLPVYEESPQEKKWSAEFNEVLQTVIEDHKESKTMDWANPTIPTASAPALQSGGDWQPQCTTASTSSLQAGDWQPQCSTASAQPLQSGEWQPQCSTAAAPSLPSGGDWQPQCSTTTTSTLQSGGDWQPQCSTTTTPSLQSGEWQPQCSTTAASTIQSGDWQPQALAVPLKNTQTATKAQNMEWSLVKESAPVKSDSESVYIAVDANPTFTAESKATSSVQFIENTVQPVVYEQFGSQLLTQAFPVPALPVLEPVVPPVAVDSVPMSSYDDAMGQIQGDPMLSETSSVIGAQKEIESAYKLVVDGSGINNGQQQWEQEWTYGTSS